MTPLDGLADALVAAERIVDAFAAPFALAADRSEATVATSVGVALSGPGLTTPDALLRAADDALLRAKAAGRGRVVVHEPAATAVVLAAPAVVDAASAGLAR